MDWISHLLFSFIISTILLKEATKEKMAVVMAASLFPDLDILWYHRSGLHSPLVLFVLALLLAFQYRTYFVPLLIGFWSHSVLDIFVFDNSNHTIQNLANQIVMNESIAQHIENNIMRYTAADGIMLFYPFNSETFSITLDEKSYAIVAGFIIIIAVLAFVWSHFKGESRHFT
jgi:membrane-bound metal-dependent hydrolase YbcI (DUF457 family)